MPVHRPPDKPPLEVLETEIVDIKPHRTSKKGTPYCALVLPSGDWVFVWEGHWKDEIENHLSDYRGLDARIFVWDKSDDDDDDPFYNLEAVVPQDPEKSGAFLDRKQQQADSEEVQPHDPDHVRADDVRL